MEFINKEIEDYISNHTNKESDLLSKLNRETWAKVLMPRMLSGHIQGQVLSLFSNITNPTNIIEIGTYTGYSALCLAEGLKADGELHTIDINEEHTMVAEKYFNKSKFSKNINQHIGNAINIIPKIKKKFQLAFIDADKENYSNYFDLLIDKIDINGIIIADNVLWSGKVTKSTMDKETKELDSYNKKVNSDPRVENVLLSVRDGLMICRKIS
ncbi:MAG: O-methyltransferase [Flavobacteriales bacterium]|jgi:caffeoyl-CoA O-methyltransferase|tara:strand:+ start:667 stop:1305 length:639 start_codon:yes stop_codon:yes gene_type:complete